jgi:hypothetical protein
MPTKPLFEGGLKYPSEALDSCKLIAYHHVDETPAARPGYPLRAGRDWPDKSASVDLRPSHGTYVDHRLSRRC